MAAPQDEHPQRSRGGYGLYYVYIFFFSLFIFIAKYHYIHNYKIDIFS